MKRRSKRGKAQERISKGAGNEISFDVIARDSAAYVDPNKQKQQTLNISC